MDATILSQREVYNRWSVVTEVELRVPNGAIEIRVIEDHGPAAAVLLYDPERRVALLVEQPRAPVILLGDAPLLEAVAGRVEKGDSAQTARAEAMEEAGVRIGALHKVATVWAMPSVSTERMDLFLASYSQADRIGPGGGAETENECITLHEIALADLWEMVRAGGLHDGKTLTLVQALRLERPDLFAAAV
jgi:nudix-type nucleoside diphosphatase (YffH/AdpP family)